MSTFAFVLLGLVVLTLFLSYVIVPQGTVAVDTVLVNTGALWDRG